MKIRSLRKAALVSPLILLVCLICALPTVSAGTATVTVNTATVLTDVSSKPIGINTNYWMDDQGLRAGGARTLAAALSEMGVRFLRYPGGEKSDGYLWSIPPFSAPNPRLARISSEDWPSNDPAYWAPAGSPGGNWSRPVYDFDEFMADCQAVGGVPVIQIAYDGIYKPAYPGGVSLTYQQAKDTAVAWVHYANVVKGYNIKYWIIGNEIWNEGYMGANPGPTQYGLDAADFAQAMKAVDPTILVGINGRDNSTFDGALANCMQYIDFLDVHSYPAWPYRDYSSYERNNPIEYDEGKVDIAQASIDKLPEPHRSRIFITCTETGSATFAIRGSWTQNDLGHALCNAEIIFGYLTDPRVRFVQFWNTRWIDNNINPAPHEYDALSPTNGLYAQGLSLKLIGNNLLDKMVAATSSVSKLVARASYSPAANKLNIFLINKDSANSYTTTVSLQGFSATSGTKWTLRGTGPLDQAPVYTSDGTVSVSNNQFTVTVAPVTITVIQFSPGGGDTQAPTAPANLAATAVSSSRIDLSWTASTDNVGVTGYKIFRGGVEIDTVTGTTYQDTGLQPSTPYSYYVKAYDAAGNISAPSNTAQATTQAQQADTQAPTAPTNLAAMAASSARIDLTWTASTDNVGVTGYQVFRNGVQVGTSGTTSYADTGLSPNTTYSYYVKAYDAAGNVSAQSNTAQATTLPAPANAMHVADIWTCDSAGNPKAAFNAGETLYWKVKIVDASGNPVPGASVTTLAAKASGDSWGTFTQTAGADGVTAIYSKKSNRSDPKGTCNVTVTNVVLSGWTYDSSANIKTTAYFTLQ